jgi:stress response protein SCP2
MSSLDSSLSTSFNPTITEEPVDIDVDSDTVNTSENRVQDAVEVRTISTSVKHVNPVPVNQLPMNQREQQFIFEEEKIRIGLRWTCVSPKTADLDLSCILLDEYANISDVVHYNKLKLRGIEHSGDDRVGLAADLKDGYNEKIDIDLAELTRSDIVCIIIYVSCYHGTLLRDCHSGRVQVKQLTGYQEESDKKQQDHLFIYETMLKTKSKYSGLIPCMFLYDQEATKWEMTVLNEWIMDCHFMDGFARILNRKVLPNRVWQPLCERLENKILETLNKEQKLLKKNRGVNRKRQKNKTANPTVTDGKMQQDRQQIMNSTIINEIRELIDPDKDPYVLDPLDQKIILHPNNKQLVAEYPKKKKLRDMMNKKEQIEKEYVSDSDEDEYRFSTDSVKIRRRNVSFSTFELDIDVQDTIELGLGWNAKHGHLHSQYYLSANMIMFGKYGHKIGFVDQRTSSKVRGCTYYPTEYRKSGKNDRVLTVKLKDVEQNVTSIIFVVVASSTMEFHGFSDLKNPYVRLSFKEGVELFRYGFPDEATRTTSKYFSLIAFKLTRINEIKNKWKLIPIVELSEGTHGLFHQKLRSQISKHIDRLPEPLQIQLVSTFARNSGTLDDNVLNASKTVYSFNSKDFANIGIDFSCIKNIKEIACFELGKYGDIKNARVVVVNEKQDLSQRKMSIQMADLSYIKFDEKTPEMLVSATSFLKYNLEKLYSDGVCHLVWVLTFNEWVADDPLDNDRCTIDSDWSNVFRAWNINDKNSLCSCVVRNVYNVDGTSNYSSDSQGTVIAILHHSAEELQAPWNLTCVDEIIPFRSRQYKYNDSKRIKQTRYVKSIEKFLNIPKEINAKVLYGTTNDDTIVSPYDLELPSDLVVGVGVERLESVHALEINVELYNCCGSFLSDFNVTSNKYKTLIFHPFRNLYVPIGNDIEQFSILRSNKSPVRHYAVTVQARSRSYFKSSDIIYIRFCKRQNCEELVRVNCEASELLANYTGKKANLDEVRTVIDLSDDEESDPRSEKEEHDGRILLAMLTFTQSGWRITPGGRFVSEEQLYKSFIPPPPTHLRIEVIEASDIKPVDKSGILNPYIELVFVDSSKKKKKKQKFITKTHYKTLAPKFNETFDFAVSSPEDQLTISMLDHDGPLKVRHTVIGTTKLKLYDALSNHVEDLVISVDLATTEGKLAARLKIRTSRLWK